MIGHIWDLQSVDNSMLVDINDMNVSLESTINSVSNNTHLINHLNNSLDILSSRIHDSEVNFAVETNSFGEWAADTRVTFGKRLTDSHNAMDLYSGIFTAPLTGTCTFFCFAQMRCDGGIRYLYAVKNWGKIEIFKCDTDTFGIASGTNVVFVMQLIAGDQLSLNSGNSVIRDYFKFSGLLQPSL